MAGLRAVLPDALPAMGVEAGRAPLAALAAMLVASLLAGLWLSRAKAGAGGRDVLAARPQAGGERTPG